MSEKLSAFIGAAGQLAAHLEKTRPADTASVTAGEGSTANVEGTPTPKAPLSKREAAKIRVPKSIDLGPAGALINEDFSDVELPDAADGGPEKKTSYKSPAELATERMVDKTNPFGVKVPKAAKKPKRARGGSFSNTEGLALESDEELKAKSSNTILRQASEHLANGTGSANKGPANLSWAFPAPEKATPKGRRNSTGKLIPEGVGEGAAHDSWAAAKDLHTVLQRHFDTLPAQFAAKADELNSRVSVARKMVENAGGLTEGDQRSLDKSVANVSNTAKWMSGQASTDSLREQRVGGNSLVQIGATLDSMKTPEGKFKESDPRRLHSLIQDSLTGLSRVHNLFKNSAGAPYGVGSPVADEDVKHAVRVSRKLAVRSAPTAVEALPRDAHPTLTEKDNDGNVSNPANAFAPKGHVWGIGLPNDLNGNVRSVEATPANLDLVAAALGEKHSTTNKLRAMVKAQDPNNPKPITSGTWFNEDGSRIGKKSYTKVAEESLTDPEAAARAETSRMRSITTKTVSTSGYSTTKPIEGVDYVPAPKADENVDVSDSGAEPGRMFTVSGKRTIKISRENLENLTRLKGEDHPDVVKMDKLYRQAKGLPTKEQDQASAEKRSVNFEKSLGKSGKTFVDSPVGPVVDVSRGALEGREIQQPASRKAEFERTVPGAQDSLIEEAAGHITAGRRIPRDLRRTIGAEGVSKAMTKANVAREPLGRN